MGAAWKHRTADRWMRRSVSERLAEGQIDSALTGRRRIAIADRLDAMVVPARWTAPDHDITACQPNAPRSHVALGSSEQEDGGQAQRDRDDGRAEVALVLVLVQ